MNPNEPSDEQPRHPGLRIELLGRAERDQEVRRTLGDLPTCEQWEAVRAVDAPNGDWIEGVIERHGWPGRDLVGADGARAAWLLVQHAALDRQRSWLPLLREAVKSGEADEVHLAYLDDRVRTREERPQRYGTQWVIVGDGQQRLFPLEAPDEVNGDRTALRLPALDDADVRRAFAGFDEIRGHRSQ